MKRQSFFNSRHHLNENGIALYVDAVQLGKMDSVPHAIRHHAEECEECSLQILEVTEMMNLRPADRSVLHPTFDTEKENPFYTSSAYRIAALFIIALFAGTIFYFMHDESQPAPPSLSGNQHNETPVPEQPATETAPAEDRFAANFEPSANLDNVATSEFRSGDFEVLSPLNGAVLYPPVTFRWKPIGTTVKLKILSNREITLQTAEVEIDSFVSTKRFAPGLYYWKIETETELLFLGKFFIKNP